MDITDHYDYDDPVEPPPARPAARFHTPHHPADLRHLAGIGRSEPTTGWQLLRACRRSSDHLAFRWAMLRLHGRQTLVNCIRGDHGLPNRY
jgi:hypothetical protein